MHRVDHIIQKHRQRRGRRLRVRRYHRHNLELRKLRRKSTQLHCRARQCTTVLAQLKHRLPIDGRSGELEIASLRHAQRGTRGYHAPDVCGEQVEVGHPRAGVVRRYGWWAVHDGQGDKCGNGVLRTVGSEYRSSVGTDVPSGISEKVVGSWDGLEHSYSGVANKIVELWEEWLVPK